MEKQYDYFFTARAYTDIDDSLSYITDTLQNPSAAADLQENLEKKVNSICDFPYAFPDCTIYSIHDKQYRHLILGNYILIFHIDEGSRTIEILRFVYGKTDIDRTEL